MQTKVLDLGWFWFVSDLIGDIMGPRLITEH